MIAAEPSDVNLLGAELAAREYELLHAATGAEGLAKAAQELPDVILLDVTLPDGNGYEITQQLKRHPRTQQIPIILITNLHNGEDKSKGVASGADEFLNRPVDPAELQARVKSLIALKQYAEQLEERLQSERIFAMTAAQAEFSKAKTLLLVEDDDVAAHLICNYLQETPYRVEFCADGLHAVERITQGQVDLLLLDIMLPGLDGFEICRQVKALPQNQNVQIVMITCLQDTDSKVRGFELGVDDFIVKPVHKQILLARINALLKKKAYLDRLTYEYARTLHSAVTDSMTGLYNHGYFEQFLRLEIERSLRQRHPLTLMLLDLDDFKQYNDTLGHLAGDEILRELAQVINAVIRKIDLAARYGGEEFAVVLPYTDAPGARIVAERLRQAVETHPFAYKTTTLAKPLTVSIGLASFTPELKTVADLVERADSALYQAKKAGKNRVCGGEQQ